MKSSTLFIGVINMIKLSRSGAIAGATMYCINVVMEVFYVTIRDLVL